MRMQFMGKLVAILAVAVMSCGMLSAADETLVLDGSTTVGPIAKAFAEYYMDKNPGVNVTVNESGSGNGAKSLINDACDIANMSRFMKEKEFKAAVKNGIFPVAHAVAMDGLAIIVHKTNPLKNITMEQLAKVYAGEITNWKDLGGPNKDIVVISRDTSSGTYETFEKVVMRDMDVAGGVEKANSNGMVRSRVQQTEAAIGYVGVGFVDETTKSVTVERIPATVRTIATGVYPIARNLYMWTDGSPKLGSHVHKFTSLWLTPEGEKIIKEIGFVPRTGYDE